MHYIRIVKNVITCLFTNLPWPEDSEATFRFSRQTATCLPVYHTRWRLHTVPFNAERQAGKLYIPIFNVFGLTRPGIEAECTVSVADALSTWESYWWALTLETVLFYSVHTNAETISVLDGKCRRFGIWLFTSFRPASLEWEWRRRECLERITPCGGGSRCGVG